MLVHVRNIDEWYTVKTALAVTLILHDPGCNSQMKVQLKADYFTIEKTDLL
jgi:hypothetical protein